MNTEKTTLGVVTALSGLVGVWAVACLLGGLASVGWSPANLVGAWLTSVGTPNTLVDYYTNIKGAEYIICACFLVLFPVYYKFVAPKETAKLAA